MTVESEESPPAAVPSPRLRFSTRTAAHTEAAARHRSSRLAVPARLRIMAWLVLLLFVALLTVVVVTRNLLQAGVARDAVAALEQETSEFLQAAAGGVDPITKRPFVDGRDLLENHVNRQYTDRDEIVLGVTAAGEVLPQPGRAAVTERMPLREILDVPERVGLLDTPDGGLQWSKVPVLTADGRPDGTFVVAHAVDRRAAEVDETIRLLALVSVAGLLLAAAASWMVSGQILQPINHVRRLAADITSDDLTRRIPVRGRDDIAALAEQFNAMLDRLDQAFGIQRQFLDDASHELRTPITIIRGNLEFLEDDDPHERAEIVRLCTDELDRMSRIVEDLLLLAKSRRPDFVVPQPTDLVDLTSDIDAKLRRLGERTWQLAAIAEGEARLDAQRITQAVIALAHNAVQHTRDGDVIAFGSTSDEHGVAFSVRDTGPGVAHGEAETIFRRFARGGTGQTVGHRSGAGLGLSIVAAIAEAHGGWAELDSVAGHGATFTVRIPGAADDGVRR
ncbi:sensor histidine kinase [Pseudonocardia sp.]|uniref:sensor histidine kinase n=1 Tax=Pseudonocardia sp. TaxID=60912 RepID=UPI003D0C5E0D